MPDIAHRAMTIEEFLPLVGYTLIADCDTAEVPLLLVSARALPADHGNQRPPFTLIFRSAPDTLLLDGSYAMRGIGFGPELVFVSSLVPPRDAERGYYYQAIFN